MTYWISTTIKKKWLDKILDGTKTSEYRKATPFWMNRFLHISITMPQKVGLNLLCGRLAYKFDVISLLEHEDDTPFDLDGEKVYHYFEIVLGERIIK